MAQSVVTKQQGMDAVKSRNSPFKPRGYDPSCGFNNVMFMSDDEASLFSPREEVSV
jgi:hypothetical protein